jgi:hypothetical protein
MTEMKYFTYWMLIRTAESCKHIEVVAVDKNAAFADLKEAYGNDVDVITWGVR